MTSTREVQPLDCVSSGEGPGLVLLHGTAVDAMSNWASMIQAMSESHRVVAPNLPGAGATPAESGPLEVAELVERVIVTAEHQGVGECFDLVGWSLGGVLAVAVAAAVPDRVRSLCVHAGWARSTPREQLMFDLWGALLQTDPDYLARTLVLSGMSPELLDRIDAETLAALVTGSRSLVDRGALGQIELNRRVDITGLLAAVTAPTLIVASTEDRVIPPHHQRALADGILGAEYVELRGGHALPLEGSPALTATLAGFVKSHAEAT